MIRSKNVIANREEPLPREPNARLARLIREEMDRMVMDKEQLDAAFPEHERTVSKKDLWQMARKRVIADLCNPDGVKGPGDEDTG